MGVMELEILAGIRRDSHRVFPNLRAFRTTPASREDGHPGRIAKIIFGRQIATLNVKNLIKHSKGWTDSIRVPGITLICIALDCIQLRFVLF